MRDIETKISPLISGLFPSFYQEEGPNFIAFVQAYYEWLEQNFQLLDLESVVDFNVGDTITQANVTGTIYAVLENSVLVLVNGLETFKCLNVCSDLIPVTSSSGGDTLILRGGSTRRLGSLFLGRNLLNIRDIDSTMDLFVVRFKEKYLRNIEFDTQTNKRLLVKNSLNLYRAKGTSRAIDLFFRLIYGIKPDVYYPGDDLFRLSDAEWFKPRYIEINSSSTDRAIPLVGKQVTGINSGASAFVERYIKKKVNGNFVHVLYVSNVKGEFIVGERIRDKELFDDSPRIVGSLTEAVRVSDGSESFSVGDLINIQSRFGDNAVGRVAAVVNGDGQVSYELIDGGWGFTTNLSTNPYGAQAANTFLSDRVLALSDVQAGQLVVGATIQNPGTGYSNTDVIRYQSRFEPAEFVPTTNNSGSVVSLKLIARGNGFLIDNELPILDTTNMSGSGIALSLAYEYPKNYFSYLEQVRQPTIRIVYSSPQNETQFEAGNKIYFTSSGRTGTLVSIDYDNNVMRVSSDDKRPIFAGDVVTQVANTLTIATIATLDPVIETTGLLINSSTLGTLTLGPPSGTFDIGDTLYQTDAANNVVASASITRRTGLTLSGGTVEVNNLDGVFRANNNLSVFGKDSSALLTNVSLKIAVANTSNTFVDTGGAYIYSATTGIVASVASASSGTGSRYRIASLKDSDGVFVNTDRLNNTSILSTRLNAVAYGLSANASANLSSVILGGLTFADLVLGTISTLGEINPGTGYTADPVTSVFQPAVTGYHAHDYIMTYRDNEKQYFPGEYVEQVYTTNYTRVDVVSSALYRKGELVHAANTTTNFVANGVIAAIEGNTIVLAELENDIPASSAYTIKSLISSANSIILGATGDSANNIARGIVKSVSGTTMTVKRIQLENHFIVGAPIEGQSTGATAILTSVVEDPTSTIAGFNATVEADASIANGVISSVQIVDSGFGFSNESNATFVSSDAERTGQLSIGLGGVGTGTGFYRNTRGFVSDLSKVHDGDYYQEYSYDIISRIPLDKYNDMFKKVMHTAGTRFFGSVLVDSLASVQVTSAVQTNSSIEIAAGTPYVIEDRQDIDIVDRDRFYIEIREF